MARRRGGYQKPSKPAAVSGPGALSQRTDGGVPQMQRTGLAYGENKAVNDQQASAPLGGSAAVGSGGGSPAPPAPGRMGAAGVFSPTRRPGEPLTAGVDAGPGAGRVQHGLPDEPYLIAKALYALAPSPELERLLARLASSA